MTDRELLEQWLRPGAIVPVTMEATRILVEALRARLAQPEPDDGYCQACEGDNCTAKDGCVALDNPIAQPEPWVKTYSGGKPNYTQPEQEPVAWKDAPTKIYLQICDDVDCDLSFEAHDDVSWCQDKINDCDVAYVRADTAPPKKEWQGLTDDEIENCFEMSMFGTCRAIEAKLREKNTKGE